MRTLLDALPDPGAGEFARLGFCDLDLVPPGVMVVSEWRPEPQEEGPRPLPPQAAYYGAVGKKP